LTRFLKIRSDLPAEKFACGEERRSLILFNKYAGTKFDVKLASVDALDSVKAKPARVCPLTCDLGFKADGARCTKLTCRPGYEVGDDNSCEKIEVKKPRRGELTACVTVENGQRSHHNREASSNAALGSAHPALPHACRRGNGKIITAILRAWLGGEIISGR
jgi:hypothetical protein